MPGTPEALGDLSSPNRAIGSRAESEVQFAASGKPRVLVVDADPALFALLEEWLAAHDFETVRDAADDGDSAARFDLIVVDVPSPRQGGIEMLRRVADRYPDAPILALSSGFFAGIDSNGNVARALGVASALPKPVKRDAFIAAVRRVLPPLK